MTQSRFATTADDSTIKRLLQDNPMDSWVSISLEREPSYFEGVSLMGKTYTLISQEESEVVGIYACSYLPVHINAKSERVGYLGSLRVSEPFRHKIRYIKEGFNAINEIIPKESTLPFFFTSLASENLKARRLLESNLRDMPQYHLKGQMSTLIFSHRRGKEFGLLKQATKQDIAEITSFYNKQASGYQFSPHLSEEWLENLDGSIGLLISDFYLTRDDEGVIQGCLALWNQCQFKQSVVQDYKSPLKQIRKFYNLYARLSRRVKLPAPKEELEHLFIAFFAFEDKRLATNILKEAANIAQEVKGIDNCVLGVSSEHPLLQELIRQFKPSIYLTEIETVVMANEEFYKPVLDERLVQPEVALL